MSVQRLASGRYRARVWREGREMPVSPLLGLPAGTTFPRRRDAQAAVARAREVPLPPPSPPVGEFWERWTTDPLFARPKESTQLHYRERTREFATAHGALALRDVSDRIVGDWLSGGRRLGQVPALRAMWNDAMSAKAGRLVDRNPFARLGIARSRGNRDVQPPDETTVRALIAAAWERDQGFGAWLQVATFTGMRPGELDALRWSSVDFERSRILVCEQFSQAVGWFTSPKNGRRRFAPLTGPAREALERSRHPGEFCFTNHLGRHWTASSRAYPWTAVRRKVGYEGSLYLATRHFAGAFMVNRLGLLPAEVAIALGHEDGGSLAERVYGHRDRDRTLSRIIEAYEEEA